MQFWQERQRRPNSWRIWHWMICLVALWILSGCALVSQLLPTLLGSSNPNLLLGNPSNAVTSTADANNYLIVRPQYVLSYSRDRGIPNWVSWQLNQSWLGSLPRSSFTPDPSLPQGWYQVTPNDYTGSGFDRGHMIPAADRNKTETDNQAVFLMTNILPQAPDNNRGPWEELESYCRGLVNKGRELYIVAGGAGSGGIGERGKKQAIDRGRIVVPASTWKVVVVLDQPGAGLQGITETTRVIAVNMPNQQGIKEEDWKTFRTSVDAIEKLTGYDLLSAVPEATQKAIEAKVDDQ
jgi:endonuclease G, mitochondrial